MASLGAAAAAPAGTVTQLDGLLFAQSAAGRVKILSTSSLVAPGDTLVSGRKTFAQITLADRGTVTLGPDSELAIDAFSFDEARPAGDRAELTLTRGGLRITSGAIAKRSPDRQKLTTTLGVITGADATYIVEYSRSVPQTVAAASPVMLAALSVATMSDASIALLPSDVPMRLAQAPVPNPKGPAPGLYVQVLDGLIHLSNSGGSSTFAAGQFGYTASFTKPPIVLPANPGMQFTPPPSFLSTSKTPTGPAKSNTVDCEVR